MYVNFRHVLDRWKQLHLSELDVWRAERELLLQSSVGRATERQILCLTLQLYLQKEIE